MPSSRTKARTNGSVSVWPGYWNGSDDGEVGDRARVGQVHLAGRPELDGIDGAVAPPAGVDPLADRAAQAEQPAVPGRLGGPVGGLGDRVPVGDRGQVVHPGHRLGRAARVLALGLRGLAGHEADDVVDAALPRAPPPGRHPHPLVMAPGVPASTAWSRGVVAPSSRMKAKAKGRSSGCCSEGDGTQVHDVDRAGRPHLDEIVGQLGAGRRVPFHGGDEHRVVAADPEDPLLGQCGHEGADHRPERPLVGEGDRAFDESGHPGPIAFICQPSTVDRAEPEHDSAGAIGRRLAARCDPRRQIRVGHRRRPGVPGGTGTGSYEPAGPLVVGVDPLAGDAPSQSLGVTDSSWRRTSGTSTPRARRSTAAGSGGSRSRTRRSTC